MTSTPFLHARFKNKGKLYLGNILDGNTLHDTSITNVLKSEFGSITAEYSWKWSRIQPKEGEFHFEGADAVFDWAVANKKLIRGHTLIWHQNIPEWVNAITDKTKLTEVIQEHIRQVAGRYKGHVYAWDVVNEPFEEDGHFRNSVFWRVLKEDFFDVAFHAAREADPNAKLYLNEYNLDYAGPKIDALLALVDRLQKRGVPIDGIGSQAHLTLGKAGSVPTQLLRLAATGLDISLTELDIRIPRPVTDAKLMQQQAEYELVVKACVDIPNCVGITLWGVSDRNSWVNATLPQFESPLLWDKDYKRKAAYRGLEALLA
ncbi:glycosyl hydrolase family 10 protein [Ephemerocybe angulata]|uniref:Beta-xylanase n=1 Tax=Ephemerocybe angulata TaxID=980116 RepID=A0A8H6HIB9_9AGAR|nr:glycosyl hydrolase family 10 protein [Tulosesus angulatus]